MYYITYKVFEEKKGTDIQIITHFQPGNTVNSFTWDEQLFSKR